MGEVQVINHQLVKFVSWEYSLGAVIVHYLLLILNILCLIAQSISSLVGLPSSIGKLEVESGQELSLVGLTSRELLSCYKAL